MWKFTSEREVSSLRDPLFFLWLFWMNSKRGSTKWVPKRCSRPYSDWNELKPCSNLENAIIILFSDFVRFWKCCDNRSTWFWSKSGEAWRFDYVGCWRVRLLANDATKFRFEKEKWFGWMYIAVDGDSNDQVFDGFGTSALVLQGSSWYKFLPELINLTFG